MVKKLHVKLSDGHGNFESTYLVANRVVVLHTNGRLSETTKTIDSATGRISLFLEVTGGAGSKCTVLIECEAQKVFNGEITLDDHGIFATSLAC